MVFSHRHGLFERHVLLCDLGGFHHHQFVDAISSGLGEETDIVAEHLGIIQVIQPASHKHVFLDDDEHGVEADALQTCGECQREIQTSALFLGKNLVGQTDALACFLETGRDGDIDNALFAERLIDRCHLGTHAVRILGLVIIEGGGTRQTVQLAGSFESHLCQS